MLTQSSFLIRCWLDSARPGSPVLRYRIEHVQTGQSLDSPVLETITAWMADVNRSFISQSAWPAEGEQQ
jgi:hypothetical protein